MMVYGHSGRRRGYGHEMYNMDPIRGLNTMLGLVNPNPNHLIFYGNPQSVQTRLDTMTDQ